MTRPRWAAPRFAAAVSLMALSLMALSLAAAGCGSQPRQSAAAASLPTTPSLALSVVSPAGTWATVEMGGSAAQHNNFWQLFVRPAGGTRWKLVTPPGMASNGGLILASPGGQSLVTAFRPSQQIRFSPLISTDDAGAHWSTGGSAAGLADVPDALAAGPGRDGLIALVPGAVELSRPGGSGWARLAQARSLAASAAGRECGLSRLTAAAFSPAGVPLAGGSCAKAGASGIFALNAGTWQAAGPTLPASLAGQPVTVLRLTVAAGRETALLSAGSRPATLIAASTGGGSDHGGSDQWALYPAFTPHGGHVLSASFGPGGAVALVLTGGRGETITGPGGTWQQLPALPAGTQTLALGTGGRVEALAAHRSIMTAWGHDPASPGWAKEQVINVPIQYGSSS
jgi:hypothetical protein